MLFYTQFQRYRFLQTYGPPLTPRGSDNCGSSVFIQKLKTRPHKQLVLGTVLHFSVIFFLPRSCILSTFCISLFFFSVLYYLHSFTSKKQNIQKFFGPIVMFQCQHTLCSLIYLLLSLRVAVMLALCTGLVIISDKRHLVGHPVWCCIGIGSGLAFCLLPSSRAFTAGCCLALFCMSLWPHVFECVLHHPPFPLVSIAMGVYLVLIMIHALVTGHDYIPGVSALLSGRPVVLMSFVLGVIVLGIQKVWVPISTTPQQSGPMQRRRSSRNSYVSFFGSAWRRLSTVSEESSSDETSDTEDVIEDEVISREENVLERLPVLKEVEYKIFLSVIRQGAVVFHNSSSMHYS